MNRPSAMQLLSVAREELLTLLDDVPPQRRVSIRMIAKAMAIAERELSDDAVAEAESALAALGREAKAEAGAEPGGEIEEALRALATQIRAGRWDDESVLCGALRTLVEARLRISNPRYLERAARHR